MLLKVVVLAITFVWLVVSIPQDMFLWASTTHAPQSFDWWMSMGRAFLIGFIPLLIVWVEAELGKRHNAKAVKAWGRLSDERKAALDVSDFDEYCNRYGSQEKRVAAALPYLFVLTTLVISIGYFAYYEQYGTELKAYHLPGGAGDLFRYLVMAVRVTITALITYVLGRLNSALDVAELWQQRSTSRKLPVQPHVQSVHDDESNRKYAPCIACGKPLLVGLDGTTRQAAAGHARWCKPPAETDIAI